MAERKKKPPRRQWLGNESNLTDGDRLVLATWSGQEVPKYGDVYLMLTPDQALDLNRVLLMLHLRMYGP